MKRVGSKENTVHYKETWRVARGTNITTNGRVHPSITVATVVVHCTYTLASIENY